MRFIHQAYASAVNDSMARKDTVFGDGIVNKVVSHGHDLTPEVHFPPNHEWRTVEGKNSETDANEFDTICILQNYNKTHAIRCVCDILKRSKRNLRACIMCAHSCTHSCRCTKRRA